MLPQITNIVMAFASEDIKFFCEDRYAVYESLSERQAEEFFTHIADLRACQNLEELFMLGQSIEIDSITDEIILHFSHGRIVIKSNHRKTPVKTDGNIDFASIWRVKILRIELNDE